MVEEAREGKAMLRIKRLFQKLFMRGERNREVEEDIDYTVITTADPNVSAFYKTHVMHVSHDTALRIVGAGMQ